MGTPAAEIDITEVLVRKLLLSQCPQYAELEVSPLDVGWDNVMLRLGDRMTIRLPRRKEAAPLVLSEQKWLPMFAERLTAERSAIQIPAPLFCGKPGGEYPWHWSILPYLEGETADLSWPAADQGAPLAEFLLAIHMPADEGAPDNPYRGLPLQDRKDSIEARLAPLYAAAHIEQSPIETIGQRALAAPQYRKKCWLHGDLHARNVLVKDGTMSAAIDWGDMTSGDIATDLAAIWYLLPDQRARLEALSAYSASDAQRMRAAGWAINIGAVLLESGLVDHPRHAEMGRVTFDRLITDHQAGII